MGSIVAQVKLDVTQWLADKAKVKEDAREIGALHPEVKVGANVAEAIAADNLTALSLPAGLVKSPSAPMGTTSIPSTAPSVSGGEGKIVNHQWNIRQNASPTAVAHEVTRRLNALAL